MRNKTIIQITRLPCPCHQSSPDQDKQANRSIEDENSSTDFQRKLSIILISRRSLTYFSLLTWNSIEVHRWHIFLLLSQSICYLKRAPTRSIFVGGIIWRISDTGSDHETHLLWTFNNVMDCRRGGKCAKLQNNQHSLFSSCWISMRFRYFAKNSLTRT